MPGPFLNLRALYAPPREKRADKRSQGIAAPGRGCPASGPSGTLATSLAATSQTPTHAASQATSQTAELRAMETRLMDGLLALERRFEETFARDTVREQLFTKLHDEVQEHKRGLLLALQRPYIMGLVQLHDAVGRTVEHVLAKGEQVFSAQEAAQLLQDFQDDVELLMQHNAIEAFQEPGTAFAPARQTSLKIVPTEDPELAGQVASRLRPGFAQQDVIVQKERVTVYTYRPDTTV